MALKVHTSAIHAWVLSPVPRRTQSCRPAGRGWAFTLVEVIAAVLIIGVISAIAIPRLGLGASRADEATLRGNLRILRDAIELYAAEHDGAYPGYHPADGSQTGDGTEADFVAQLLECSSSTGATAPAASARVFGPYLREIPRLNVGKNSASGRKPGTVRFKLDVPLDEHEVEKAGWIFNPRSGEIIANTTAVDTQGTPFKSY